MNHQEANILPFDAERRAPKKRGPVPEFVDLTDEYLWHRLRDNVAHKDLIKVCEYMRDNFLKFNRQTKDVPNAVALAEYISGQMPMILKEKKKAADIYVEIENRLTDYIKRKQKQAKEEAEAKAQGKKAAPLKKAA